MGVILGQNQYGKAECRVVRIVRDTPRHEIVDLNVTTSLRGDFAAAHISGDQSQVLPTDTQKNTAFAYAKEVGVGSIETYALALGRRLLAATPAATSARVLVEQYAWDRVDDGTDGGHDHAFVRRGGETRTCEVVVHADTATPPSITCGLRDLVVLKSTGSAFKGFLVDEYTTLPETDDRILATSLVARWRHAGEGVADQTDAQWNASYDGVRRTMLRTFADTFSRALQETLYAMGRATIEEHPTVAAIGFSAPNKHHFLVDLAPFGLENPGEVFVAADRPYGLIEATVLRSDLATLNEASDAEARRLLAECLDVDRWVQQVAAGRPYADADALLAAASAAAEHLDDAELQAALARHPRIGERAGAGHDAAHSASEQAGVDHDDADVAGRLAEGNRAYEQRFDRVFLIRAKGRDAEEILAELERRLGNDDDAERAETVTQLREIALLRLRALVGDDAS
jgi:urate oxidase